MNPIMRVLWVLRMFYDNNKEECNINFIVYAVLGILCLVTWPGPAAILALIMVILFAVSFVKTFISWYKVYGVNIK